MGVVLMTVLTVVVLAVSVVESRDRVRRDRTVDIASLRSWYDVRYGRRGRALDRPNLERALKRARGWRRWGPVALSASTAFVAATVIVLAASGVPGIGFAVRAPSRLIEFVPAEVLVETMIVFVLLPVLVIEGILAALYVADYDIGRLQRLLDSLG